MSISWKDWCWSSSTLATWCQELTHWKRLWCWEGLGAGEGDDRGWDGWMASLTRWTWVRVNSGSWWWTGRPGVLRFMGSQRAGHDWATEPNWTELQSCLEDVPGFRGNVPGFRGNGTAGKLDQRWGSKYGTIMYVMALIGQNRHWPYKSIMTMSVLTSWMLAALR